MKIINERLLHMLRHPIKEVWNEFRDYMNRQMIGPLHIIKKVEDRQ